jgi:hypothetical protein
LIQLPVRDEIAILKGEKAKSEFKPSGMEERTAAKPAGEETEESKPRRTGSSKRPKTQELTMLCGERPASVLGGHFGPGLRAYVLYQQQ